jgi:hypothetical protein
MLRTKENRSALVIGLALTFLAGCACAVLVGLGNPGNMGVCGICFLRDTAGALKLFSGSGPKIFRPEVVGLIVGAFAWTTLRGRFAARSGSHAITRLFFGIWMGIGALVFLGCPFRMLQRIGGGDLNAAVGLIGFVLGVGVGLLLENRGYSVGKTSIVPAPAGSLGLVAALMLLLLFLSGNFLAGPGPGEPSAPAHAAWYWSLGIAGLVGVALSATGFCAVSAARQVFVKQKRMLSGAVLLIVGYAVVSFSAGRWKLGFDGQPAAHSEWVWNILALALVGLSGVLAGGCPVRQIVLAGEGNGDGFVTVIGLLLGGALAHNMGLASSGAGTTTAGRWAVVIGLTISLAYGALIARDRAQANG